jgi:hypothetical protein
MDSQSSGMESASLILGALFEIGNQPLWKFSHSVGATQARKSIEATN